VSYHLAQVNIALPREPLDSPALAEFVAALDPINALADASPGFVWRLQTDEGDATGIRAFGDERLIVNLSVWESLTALRAFVYSSGHREVLRRRREWFERMAEAHLTLWWVEAGALPTVGDAEERLAHLQAHGPTPYAFTFRASFPPEGATEPVRDDAELCPA
jgi:heme-degrading monooxygenase HmoA